ncbi:MAG TPA: response regulator transcription factor [Mycobacteriales bacterium]|nr:response regulator transcription factor [Mycobacteriales bacterium]
MIRLVVADDQPLVRAGLRTLLDAEPDIAVVGEAADGREAVNVVARERPDVVLMDVRMPRLDGISATKELIDQGSTSKVVVLTTFDLDEYVFDALRSGAVGFLLKDAPPAELAAAVRTAAAGEALLSPSLTRRLIEEFARLPAADGVPAPVLDSLTARERDVLVGVARGQTNAEIGRELFISEATVRTHVTRVFAKLEVRDRASAVVVAYESGLVRPGA